VIFRFPAFLHWNGNMQIEDSNLKNNSTRPEDTIVGDPRVGVKSQGVAAYTWSAANEGVLARAWGTVKAPILGLVNATASPPSAGDVAPTLAVIHTFPLSPAAEANR
jgi:hypothetical protein